MRRDAIPGYTWRLRLDLGELVWETWRELVHGLVSGGRSCRFVLAP
ncbi:MAG TPA: hypothetical protein VMQ38_13775 [Mycobacterium sp.]|jgi:hypothetical protein|nr:hypothetical protein [Mycobacterium sp.]